MQVKQHETALSRHAEKLFQALQELGEGWHSRAEIAAHLEKMRVDSYDGAALDLLLMQGRIEAERHEINAPIRERWEYRIKQD